MYRYVGLFSVVYAHVGLCIVVYASLGYEFLVSKETVVLRRWERSKQKFGFIKRVDKTKFLF